MGQGNYWRHEGPRRPSRAKIGDVVMISRYLSCPDADAIARKANATSSTSLFRVCAVVVGIRREQRVKTYDVAFRCKRCGKLVQVAVYGDEFMPAEHLKKLLHAMGTSVEAMIRRSGRTQIKNDRELQVARKSKKTEFAVRPHPVLLQDGPESYYSIRSRLQRKQTKSSIATSQDG